LFLFRGGIHRSRPLFRRRLDGRSFRFSHQKPLETPFFGDRPTAESPVRLPRNLSPFRLGNLLDPPPGARTSHVLPFFFPGRPYFQPGRARPPLGANVFRSPLTRCFHLNPRGPFSQVESQGEGLNPSFFGLLLFLPPSKPVPPATPATEDPHCWRSYPFLKFPEQSF